MKQSYKARVTGERRQRDRRVVPVSDSGYTRGRGWSGVTVEMIKAPFPRRSRGSHSRRRATQCRVWSARPRERPLNRSCLGRRSRGLQGRRRGYGYGMRTAAAFPRSENACDSALARGELRVSQESPASPPVLPNFGMVRVSTGIEERPRVAPASAPPPSRLRIRCGRRSRGEARRRPSTREHRTIASRNDRRRDVHDPGLERHRDETSATRPMSEVRTASACALLNVAMHDAAVGCWEDEVLLLQSPPSRWIRASRRR